MLLVLWTDQLAAKHLEAGERALLVRAHQPAIAGYIGDENSGELALGLIRSHWGRVLPVPCLHGITECYTFGVILAGWPAMTRAFTFDRAAPTLEPWHAAA